MFRSVILVLPSARCAMNRSFTTATRNALSGLTITKMSNTTTSSMLRHSPMLLSPSLTQKFIASQRLMLAAPNTTSSTNNTTANPLQAAVARQKSNTKRPVSPHLTIYKMPMPALTSIVNRVSGVLMYMGFSAAAAVALVGSCDIPMYIHMLQSYSVALVPLTKLAVGFPFLYHFLAGLRHLYWDHTGKGLDLSELTQSSNLLIGVTAVATVAVMVISLN